MHFLSSKKENDTTAKRRAENKNTRKNKMFVLRKRQLAAGSLIILIGVAGYLNMTIQNGEEDPNISVMYSEASKKLGEAKMVNSTENSDEQTINDGEKNNVASVEENYFTNAKMEREKKRGESIDMLTEIINSQGADQSSKERAQTQIEQLAKFTENEVAAENMIKAKGYGNCIVFMGENITSVAVETNGLNEIDAAVITEIVSANGIVKADQIKIVEIKPN